MEKTASIENQDWFWPIIFKEIESNEISLLASLATEHTDSTSSVIYFFQTKF